MSNKEKIIKKYDKNNNLFYYKDSYYEYWYEYDENNNRVYTKCSDGREIAKRYDKNNNLIYRKDDYSEKILEYDKYNNCIHCKESNGYEYWREYDENNKEIHYKSSMNEEKWYKYYSDGKKCNISKEEFKQIERKKVKEEFLSRKKCSRFEIMDI